MTRRAGPGPGGRRAVGGLGRLAHRLTRGETGHDRGSGTVLAVAVTGVLLAATLAALLLGAAVVASHRARLAADLAALAGARIAQLGAPPGQACGEAARVATRNGAAVVSCTVEGADLSLVVSVEVGAVGQATARSRAGPDPR